MRDNSRQPREASRAERAPWAARSKRPKDSWKVHETASRSTKRAPMLAAKRKRMLPKSTKNLVNERVRNRGGDATSSAAGNRKTTVKARP